MKGFCKDCDFFDSGAGPTWGQCKRYAPRPKLLKRGDALESYWPAYPAVVDNGWCGEFVANDPASK